MQLRADQLAGHLKQCVDKGLRPVYTVFGDEPLLAQEATDSLRSAARAAGHTERQVHTVAGAHFDWSGWDMALFAIGSEATKIHGQPSKVLLICDASRMAKSLACASGPGDDKPAVAAP